MAYFLRIMARLISETCAYISPDGKSCHSSPHVGSKFCFQHKMYEKMDKTQTSKKPISTNAEIRVVFPGRGKWIRRALYLSLMFVVLWIYVAMKYAAGEQTVFTEYVDMSGPCDIDGSYGDECNFLDTQPNRIEFHAHYKPMHLHPPQYSWASRR